MSRRLTLRLAVLSALAGGALLAPATAAVADDPTPAASATTAEDSAVAKRKAEADKAAKAKEAKEAARKAGADNQLPRGGVAAGEAVTEAGNSGTGTAALAGSAAGALLLAGAGTFVVRRRTTARRNG
ncbi:MULTISPECIES: sortase-dependent protein [unclassified Streptomyces]|uniref:sortase-dependent protein n=1 Tax=unclassified Streptomyces TaxID=2593676 RepID=UPI00382A449D